MNILKNSIVSVGPERKFLADVIYQSDKRLKPVLIFAHGFKGFKDWGHWHLIGKKFAEAGIVFVKFNFSFNGTSLDNPEEFVDLEAFGHNNYTREMEDVEAVLQWVVNLAETELSGELDLQKITIAGHSRGGPIALLSALEQDKIARVITWASVHSLEYAWLNTLFLEDWKKEGVYHVKNGRTGQMMPLYWQLYEDFEKNKSRLSLKSSIGALTKPTLIIHGKADPAVPWSSANKLKALIPHAALHFIEDADHVFNGRHPYEEDQLPKASTELVERCLNFLDSNW